MIKLHVNLLNKNVHGHQHLIIIKVNVHHIHVQHIYKLIMYVLILRVGIININKYVN